MKKKVLVFISLMIATVFVYSYSDSEKAGLNALLLENIEAFANDEHGDIDSILVPYSKLGSKTIYVILDGQILTTQVPCCMSDTSPFSGCAAGLDNC